MGSFINRFVIRPVKCLILGAFTFGFLMVSGPIGNHKAGIIQSGMFPYFSLAASLTLGFFADRAYSWFKNPKDKSNREFTKTLYFSALLSGGSLVIWYFCGEYDLNMNLKTLDFHRTFEIWQAFIYVFGLFYLGRGIRKLKDKFLFDESGC
jgi:hypothetical protein